MSKILIIGGQGRQGRALRDYLYAECDLVESVDKGDDVHSVIDGTKWDLVFSCAPYSLNEELAGFCFNRGLRWADLGGHWQTSGHIREAAERCGCVAATDLGLAPGFVEQIAWRGIQKYGVPKLVHMYCGGLPLVPHNVFGHALCFSTEGLVNEYVNSCTVLRNGEVADAEPMGDLVQLFVAGASLEAANTSGAISTSALQDLASLGVKECSYRTLRYLHHWGLVKHVWGRSGESRTRLSDWIKLASQEALEDVVFARVAFDDRGWDFRIKHEDDLSAMQRGTAGPAASAALLIASGEFDDRRIVTARDIGEHDFFWKDLNSRFGLDLPELV